jgi:hypothetical protein
MNASSSVSSDSKNRATWIAIAAVVMVGGLALAAVLFVVVFGYWGTASIAAPPPSSAPAAHGTPAVPSGR